MVTPMNTPMNTSMNAPMQNEAILTLVQWLSPAYPVGAFAYSHGLEWAVEAQDVHDSATLSAWLEGVLRHGAGWCDALFLAAAYRADDPKEVDRMARAFAPSAERLKETTLQGAAFAETTGQVWGSALPALTYPVALGHSARRHDLPLELTLQMYLQAFMANLVAAGMRLIPLGQTNGQTLIKRYTPLCAAIAAEAIEGTLDNLSSTAFLSDIASMKHEQQYSRIFRT